MKRFANFYFWLFIIILILVGFFAGDLKVNAATTAWTSQEVRLQEYDGTSTTWNSYHSVSGTSVYVFPQSDYNDVTTALGIKLNYNGGLSTQNTYQVKIGFKYMPSNALSIRNYFFENSSTGENEEVACTERISENDYHWYTCSFTPKTNYSSSNTLYIKFNFDALKYVTDFRVRIDPFDERTGTNAVVTDVGNQIINNQQQNTQEIINNINEANENLLNGLTEQNYVCKIYDKDSIKTDNKYLAQNGTEGASTNYGISDYININNGKITPKVISSNDVSLCFYNSEKTLINCMSNTTMTLNTPITIPNNAYYIRFTIRKNTNAPQLEVCINGNQAVSDGINDINNTINDDNVDNPSSALNDMEDLLPSNGVITQLIALPITLFQKVLNSIDGTCQSFDLGELYGTHLIMPCIDLQQYLGTFLWNTIDLITSGVFVLTIARKMIKAFENFTSMKEGDVIND